MAYARFGQNGSAFYVYWSATGKDETNWRNQIVDVDCLNQFTAERVDRDIESVLEICTKDPITNPRNPGFGKPQSELKEELRKYLNSFLQDVKETIPDQ